MEFMQDSGLVTTISFRTDGNPIMATGSTVGHVVFWNLEERRVSSLCLSHCGNYVIIGYSDGYIDRYICFNHSFINI
jgi:WD40 repeat protein